MVTVRRRIRRNDPCSCGSGKKYKFCCLKKISERTPAKELDHKNASALAMASIADRLDKTLAEHAKRRITTLSFHYDIAYQLQFHKRREEWLAVFFTAKFLVLCLRRSESLIAGIAQAIRMHDYLVALLCIRAHYETLGCLGHALRVIREFARKTIDYRELYAKILRLQLGTRRSRLQDEDRKIVEGILGPKYRNEPLFQAYNILTLIDNTDKIVSMEPEKQSLRQLYDILSEYCHPNADGLHVGTSHYLEREAIIEFDAEFDDLDFLYDATMMLTRFIDLYDEAWKSLSVDQIKAIKIRRGSNAMR